MIMLSAFRFARNAREIDKEEVFPDTGSLIDLALAALLVLLGAGFCSIWGTR